MPVSKKQDKIDDDTHQQIGHNFARIVGLNFQWFQGVIVNNHYLPVTLHEKAFFFSGSGRIPPYCIPHSMKSWLLDPGSLTQRLVQNSQGHFQVKLIKQGHLKPNAAEQEQLKLKNRQKPFIREVTLQCYGKSWVFARTVIPCNTLQGPARALMHLGSTPLGAALFNNSHVHRGPISVQKIYIGNLYPELKDQGEIWGRQSIFTLYNKPLLVSEYFLKNCPIYPENGHS